MNSCAAAAWAAASTRSSSGSGSPKEILRAIVTVIEAFEVDIIEKYSAFRRLQQAGNQFDERRFAAAAPAHECHHPPWNQIERDILQDVRRFGSAVFEVDSAQFYMPFETMNWDQPGAIMTLLWFLLENVVQTIQEDRGELHRVPNPKRAQNPR